MPGPVGGGARRAGAGTVAALATCGRDDATAWLRYWLYGDEAQRAWFFGSDCTLCKAPWTDIQRKNHEWD